jgi:hypothetical protein
MIFGEIPRLLLAVLTAGLMRPRGIARMRTAVTGLPALPAGFRRAFAIVGEIARTVLTANMTGAGGLFTVLGEIPRVPRMGCFSHLVSSLLFVKVPDRHIRYGSNETVRAGLSSQLA